MDMYYHKYVMNGLPQKKSNAIFFLAWILLFFSFSSPLTTIFAFASSVNNVKKGTVYIDGPNHLFYGNVTIEENIQTNFMSGSFNIITHYEANTRYRISFFPYVKKTLDTTIDTTMESPFGEVMYTIYNNTIATSNNNNAIFQIDTFNNSKVSLSKEYLTTAKPNSVVGRTLAVESCEMKLNTVTNKMQDYCKIIANGVVGVSKVDNNENNIASGSSYAYEKTLACFLTSNNNHTLNKDQTYGTFLMRRRDNEQYVYENYLRMSNIKFGGSTHALRLQTIGDLPLNEYGTVYDLNNRSGMSGFPCASKRRIGDMGNVPSTPDGDGSYRSIFKLPIDFKDLLGKSCVLYRKSAVTCEAWDEGCTNRNINNNIIARGIIGLAESSMPLPVHKPADYDCTSLVKAYAHAKLMQFGSGKPIGGYVDFFAADTDGGGNSGINHISLQLTLTGIQLGTMVNNGIGILRHGEPLSGEYSRLPSNYASDPSNFERFDPSNIAVHSVPPYARRVGDLGNIIKQNVTRTMPDVQHLISYTISGDSPSIQNTFTSVVGRTFVVYQNKDNGTYSQPNGNVGIPWAWGIIGMQLIPPSSDGSQAVRNVAKGGTENDDTKHLVAEMVSMDGETVKGIVELDLINDPDATSADDLMFQAYGKFKSLSPKTPYQWLILGAGAKETDTKPIVATADNVLVKNSLFPNGEKVPDCASSSVSTSSSSNELKKYYDSSDKIGNFGIIMPPNNITEKNYVNSRVEKVWEKRTSISTLGAYAGLTVVLVQLEKNGALSNPKVVASGILGVANYPTFSTAINNRKSTSIYSICNGVEVKVKVYEGFPKNNLIMAEEIIALLVGFGITMLIVSISAGIFFVYYGKKKEEQLNKEGPTRAINVDDGPPPPPLPDEKDVDTVTDMDQLGYTSVVNPMVELAEKNKAKEMEMTSLRKRTNTLSRTGLPVHPSKKNLKMGKSFYNPRKLEAARSVHRMNKAVSQQVLVATPGGHRRGASHPITIMKRISSMGAQGIGMRASANTVNIDRHGRSFMHLPTKDGGSRIAKIGPPIRNTVARRGLPTHPSMMNVKKNANVSEVGAHEISMQRRKRRSTRRHSEVEQLVGWDQLNMGVRTSTVGEFLSDEEMRQLALEYSSSDYGSETDD